MSILPTDLRNTIVMQVDFLGHAP
eukprot:SAG22_NODE_21708_length_254_cov_1.658065_1_plen_23_part_10